jgi:hypothetical protein
MKLADLRRLSIRKNLRIRFRLSNGLECVITEHGIAQVPELRRVPEFNLECELGSVDDFVLESAGEGAKRPAPSQQVKRAELAALVAPTSPATAEHEEE